MAQDLWQLRRQKRMTIDELARTAGVHPALIKAYELGERAIPERDLERLASALEVEVEDIKELSDPPPRGPSRAAAPQNFDTDAPRPSSSSSLYDSSAPSSRYDSGSRYGSGQSGSRYGGGDFNRSGGSGYGERSGGSGYGENRPNYGEGRPSYGNERSGGSGYGGERSSGSGGYGERSGGSGYGERSGGYGERSGGSGYGGERSGGYGERSGGGYGERSGGSGYGERSSGGYGDRSGGSGYGGGSDYNRGYGDRSGSRYGNDREGMRSPRPPYRQDRPERMDRPDRMERRPDRPDRPDRPLKRPGLKRRPQVAPARPTQLEHLKILLQQLDMSGDDLLRLAGKPLSMLNRREASHLLTTCQDMLAERRPERPKGKRQRPYLPESVDEYELVYLTQIQLDGNPLHVTLFDGSKVEGTLQGFSPYALTVKTDGGDEVTLQKLAIAYYQVEASADDEQDDQDGEQ